MATDLNGPAAIVQDAYDRSVQLADDAVNSLETFTAAMANTFQTAPTINVQWATIPAPSIEALPDMPTMPEIVFNAPMPLPAALDATLPDIGDIQDFDVAMPTMDFGTAPTVNIGQVPSIPSIGAIAIPSAPSIVLPSVPEYLTLSTPMFSGIDLHSEFLQKLEDMPELVLAMPTPLKFSRGPQYASQLLENLKAALNERLRGGTGLNPAVEQALWERGRDRESQIWLTQEADIVRSSESMGFVLPPGVLNSQLSRARKDYFSKLSGLSRDISIKQAELEQSNLQQTITQGMQLENQLMDYAIRVEQMAFEMAKAAAESAIQIYNAGIDHFKVLLSKFQLYAQTYDTIMRGELARIDVYKAQLQGEQTKAEINSAKVQQYKAQIEGGMSQVEIYKAQIGGVQAVVEVEKARLQAAGEQIRAHVAGLNAETAKMEIYKTRVSAETGKVQGYATLAQVYTAQAGAKGERARVAIARFQALAQAKESEWNGYGVRAGAESSRISALSAQSNALGDAYKMAAAAVTEKAKLNATMWDASIQQYSAALNVAFQASKANNEAVMATNAARQDMAKAGAQVYAQLAASAYNIVATSASISGSVSQVVNSSE